MCKAELVFKRADRVVTDGGRSSSSDCRTALKQSLYSLLLSRCLLCLIKSGFPELTSVILLFDITDADTFCLGNLSCPYCPMPTCVCVVAENEGATAATQPHNVLRGSFVT